MKNENKKYTIEEGFCAVPELRKFFIRLRDYIDNFDPNIWQPGATLEKLKLERDLLLTTFCNMTITDLHILFYIHEIAFGYNSKLERALREYYEGKLATENVLTGEKRVNPLWACVIGK